MQVATSATPTYKKKHFCAYCHKFQAKISRHLEQMHTKEDDVKKFIHLPKNNRERKNIIDTIRKHGDSLYNTQKKFNQGDLLVCRRPNEKVQRCAASFSLCPICKGEYSKSTLRHHFRKCSKTKNLKRGEKSERIIMIKGRAIAGRIHEKADMTVREHILPYMREDEIICAIRYDKLVILFANRLCEKYGTHQHHYVMIRARLRLLGQFLVAIKSIRDSITDLASIYHPQNYMYAIRAVKIVAGFDESKHTYKHPAVASGLGTLLKQVGEIWRSECIITEQEEKQKYVENFLKLRSENYGTIVNRAVVETQTQNNRRKTVQLPNTNDITKLHDFLSNLRKIHFERLQHEFSLKDWRKLAEATLISLLVFNRRRPGEIERIYVDDFIQYRGIHTNDEVFQSLSTQGIELATKYVRFMIRGKKNRGVPVLVPSEILECLQLIKKHRKDAGVRSNNPYLFGISSEDPDRYKHLQACNLLRDYASACGAENPAHELLRATQLRKHIATKCISLNMTENQVSELANFMGYHEKIHKEIYRQPLIETDIVKISQLLEAAQGTEGLHDSVSDQEEGEHGTDVNVSPRNRNNSKIHRSIIQREDSEHDTEDAQQPSISCTSREFDDKCTNKKRILRTWSEEARNVVMTTFKRTMAGGKMPSGSEMQKCIKQHACLSYRTVPQLRAWLYTQRKLCTE